MLENFFSSQIIAQLKEIASLFWTIFKNWWWFFGPLILYYPLRSLYFWWLNWHVWYPKIKWILIEIKPPREILKSFKAMEDIFNQLWAIAYHRPNWKERWCEGELFTPTSGWFSAEIVSIGGQIHFYFRIREGWRNMVESTIYAQYPDIEISLVDDYTKNVPSDIPNKDWDFYGEEYRLLADDPFPIKTYSSFFEKEGETVRTGEEKIDPLNSFLEDLSRLKPGEQFWFQIIAESILPRDHSWQARGKEIINKLTKRPEKPKPKPILQEAIEILISGPPKPKEEKEVFPPEMKLTPGEREFLKSIENKIYKPSFKVSMRALYLAKRDVWFAGNKYLARTYLSHFINDPQGLAHWGETRAKVHYFLRSRRIYLRKRKLLRNYINRFHPKYPRGSSKGCFVLNIEELATIFHFPSKITVPTLPYVEAKKAGPPPNLPI